VCVCVCVCVVEYRTQSSSLMMVSYMNSIMNRNACTVPLQPEELPVFWPAHCRQPHPLVPM